MKNKSNLSEPITSTLAKLKEDNGSCATIESFERAYDSIKLLCANNSFDHCNENVKKRGRRGAIAYTTSCYDDIVEKYEAYLYQTGKARKDVRRRTHIVSLFLAFVERENIPLGNLSVPDIYAAFQNATDKGSFRRLVGAFLKYAYNYKLISTDLSFAIPSVVRHQSVPSVYSPEEIEQLLATNDRTTGIGKRDYAILLIAARLGLRASDIAGLRFDSLCEKTSTIKVVQTKTKNLLKLPLLYEVKIAILDYINNARPIANSEYIFLNVDGLGTIKSDNIGQIAKKAFIKSGINCGARRIGSHSFRASLATALLDEGNEYTTIRQVLGQSDVQSTDYYVKADIEKLRINALPPPPPTGNFKTLLSGGDV